MFDYDIVLGYFKLIYKKNKMPKTTAKVLLFGSHYLMESFKGDHMVTGDSPAMGATCRVYKRFVLRRV